MSCIRFSTAAQRKAMREQAPVLVENEDGTCLAAPSHPVPPVTDSKLARLRLLAEHADPKVRESVALNRHTSADVRMRLASDPDRGVRGSVARNETTSAGILRRLAEDESEMVRGWVAVNVATPDDVVETLSHDASDTVRGLVRWRIGVRLAR